MRRRAAEPPDHGCRPRRRGSRPPCARRERLAERCYPPSRYVRHGWRVQLVEHIEAPVVHHLVDEAAHQRLPSQQPTGGSPPLGGLRPGAAVPSARSTGHVFVVHRVNPMPVPQRHQPSGADSRPRRRRYRWWLASGDSIALSFSTPNEGPPGSNSGRPAPSTRGATCRYNSSTRPALIACRMMLAHHQLAHHQCGRAWARRRPWHSPGGWTALRRQDIDRPCALAPGRCRTRTPSGIGLSGWLLHDAFFARRPLSCRRLRLHPPRPKRQHAAQSEPRHVVVTQRAQRARHRGEDARRPRPRSAPRRSLPVWRSC